MADDSSFLPPSIALTRSLTHCFIRGVLWNRPEDIDTAVSQGLGLRWAFLGPFETIDLNAPQGVAE